MRGNVKGEGNMIREKKMMNREYESPAKSSAKDMDHMVTMILREMGIPANIKGYPYLRKAIIITASDMSIIGAVTKLLYPDVAKCYQTNALCVEHAIRRAIEVAWERADSKVLKKYLGDSMVANRKKPTNSEFIATIAEMLRMREC